MPTSENPTPEVLVGAPLIEQPPPVLAEASLPLTESASPSAFVSTAAPLPAVKTARPPPPGKSV
jgi:hypothetical protein